jgi:hypothetical protein
MNENRTNPRAALELNALVRVKEADGVAWEEDARVISISRNGAGIMLPRPCKVGRLAGIVLPMPSELRAYDPDSEEYHVIGLVQYCTESALDDSTVYNVGLAFTGKEFPPSYEADPEQSYRISGKAGDGLWQITEVEQEFITRGGSRYWVNLDVTLSLIKRKKKDTDREETITQNIGERGASVFSTLDAKVGDKVKFGCKALDFYAVATVRNRNEAEGRMMTLHLEYIDQRIASEKLHSAQMRSREA